MRTCSQEGMSKGGGLVTHGRIPSTSLLCVQSRRFVDHCTDVDNLTGLKTKTIPFCCADLKSIKDLLFKNFNYRLLTTEMVYLYHNGSSLFTLKHGTNYINKKQGKILSPYQ